MSIINDIPWPMPRGGRPTPRFQPPHPASGAPPDLLDIIAEAATLRPPHPQDIAPGDLSAIQETVNNPDLSRIPGSTGLQAALNMARMNTATGAMPGLDRTFAQELADAIMQQLDSEARIRPTLGRMMLRGSNAPTIDDIMGLEGGPPRLSNFFEGATPLDNPDVIRAKVGQLRANLDSSRPNLKDAEHDALLEEISRQEGSVDPGYEPFIDPQGTEIGNTENIDALLKALEGMTDQSKYPDAILELLRSGALSQGLAGGSALDAVMNSGIGSGGRGPGENAFSVRPTVGPEGRRSLAPDMDPTAMRVALTAQGQNDPELLMRLMGLNRTRPRADR